MGPWTALLVAYLIGGVTFVPLLVGLVLLHAHYTLPFRHDLDGVPDGHPHSVVQDGDDTAALDAHRAKERGDGGSGSGGGDDDGRNRRKKDSDAAVHEMDVAAGYFAVCREYKAMGINAKPIERLTPVGTATVAPPSPSVYQTMYRSIFDRKPVPGPIENNSMSHRPKKAGNVFYVVLRHGHIMLFDDEEQLEVRHVISLAHYDISIYSGGDETPEGELFIKRNALCLTRRDAFADDGGPVAKPFYLFSENCSAKEDFYFALLKNQEQTFPGLDGCPPRPKHFDIKDIITLVQRLHSSEENIHSRWINALLGRLFLSVYRTKDLENFIASKIAKKISRVKTPSYLTNIAIRKIDTGEAAPFFHNLRLKEFTVDGECVVETDMRYAGQFRLEVSATAKIDLGARIKAREVNLVLALVMRRIEGHVLFKIKPPPSNRLWLSFQAMPKMELAIEPVVSSRQITYTVILRQIENRIKEVFAETLVQPFWDDVPFFRTEHKQWRGGIFEGDDAVEGEEDAEVTLSPPTVPISDVDGPVETVVGAASEEQAAVAEPPASPRPGEKSQTMPTLESQAPVATGLFGRRLGTNKPGAHSPAAASTVSLDAKGAAATTSRSPNIIKHSSVEPIVGTAAAHADWFRPSTSPPDHATSLIAALHSKAQQEASSPLVTPVGSPSKHARSKPSDASSVYSKEDGAPDTAVTNEPHSSSDGTTTPPTRRNTVSSHGSSSHEGGNGQHSPNGSAFSQAGSIGRKFFMKRENSNASVATTSTGTGDSGGGGPKRNNTLAAVTNAANQARQWGWNAIQRQKDARRHGEAASSQVDLSQPMGRGQPLPPPGMPLPGPTNGKTKIVAPIAVPKRKPVPPVLVLEDRAESSGSPDKEPERPRTSHSQKHEDKDRETRPPPLPQRRRRATAGQAIVEEQDAGVENVLVISAPDDSQPPTPMDDEDDGSRFAPSQDDGKIPAAADGIPRKPVPVPITIVKDVVDPEEDKTPVAYPVPRLGTTEAAPTEFALDDDDLPQEDGKPLMAMPLSTTPPEATVEEEEDDDGFAGWMDEDSGPGTPPHQPEDALPPPMTSLVK